jgi:glutathione synthase/RimK-type ligase-like ATP-grasp enzyme
VLRLGSTTESDIPIQINSVDAVKTSSSKLLMKAAFREAGVNTPKWGDSYDVLNGNLKFPIVAKKIFGSRGNGLVKVDDIEQFNMLLDEETFDTSYYFEEYHNYTKEYRLHVTKDGSFYTCRKMLKEDTPEEERYFRNDSNCVWYVETNTLFNKPVCWPELERQCVAALAEVGLDVGAFDVRVNKTGEKFKLIEVNSAPSFGEGTAQAYRKMLPNLIQSKIQNL